MNDFQEFKDVIKTIWNDIKSFWNSILEAIEAVAEERKLRSSWVVPKDTTRKHQVLSRKPLLVRKII